jgi:hypothetical protein
MPGSADEDVMAVCILTKHDVMKSSVLECQERKHRKSFDRPSL